MKILQINTTYQNGSTGRIASDLQALSERLGIENYVAYGYDTGNNPNRKSLCLQSFYRRKINILRTRLFDHHGFYNEEETKRLIQWMDNIQPDIIHLHNLHNHYIHVGKLFDYIKNHNIPIVWTLHDCWAFTGHCSHFDYIKCTKWKTECHHCEQLDQYPPTWFFDRSIRNYHDKRDAFCGVKKMVLVSPSHWLADLTRESFLKEYPVKVVNNGVDISVFKPTDPKSVKQRLGIGDKKMMLAMAAGFGIRKGGEYLKKLPEILHDDEVLVLVGRGAKAQASLHSDKCVGIEYTNDIQELAEYYSAADIFINPTLEDNFPTTNIEAMACGTPVVTFNTGGSIEAVLDGEDIVEEDDMKMSSVGIVVPQGHMDLMLQAARKVIDKGKGIYRDACRRKAEERYDKNKQYLQYIDLYKEMLQ